MKLTGKRQINIMPALLHVMALCWSGDKSLSETITVYPKKYAHGFCFAVLCCGYTLTDFPISIRLTSLALRQSNDCPSASKATLMNMDKYFMWIHYERLHNHNKAKHNKTVYIFLGIYCMATVHWCLNASLGIDGLTAISHPLWQSLSGGYLCFFICLMKLLNQDTSCWKHFHRFCI